MWVEGPYEFGRELLAWELLSDALRVWDLMWDSPSACTIDSFFRRSAGGGGLSLAGLSK